MSKIINDKYYTPKILVNKVIELIEKEIKPIKSFSRIIEPSSGDGAFLKELPNTTIGYDIEPHFNNGNVIKGDYLTQNIIDLDNSLVIGNPPFDDGSGSNNLHIKFIEKSIMHSEYVVFVLPIDMYNKNNLQNAELIKSFRVPPLKFSNVKLKTCINIYKKRNNPLYVKKIKDVEIFKYARGKNKKYSETDWYKINADYRIITFGRLKIINPMEHIRCSEMKINFKNKRNFSPLLEKFLEYKNKNSISTSGLSKQELIDFIYDVYPDCRAD